MTCPGFIDAHCHADRNILKYPLAENLVMQGITTFVGGNCGDSRAPTKDHSFKEHLLKVEKTGISPNYVPLVGHYAIRGAVMEEDFKRAAKSAEIEEMKKYVEEAMQSGAFGLSSLTIPFRLIKSEACLYVLYQDMLYPNIRGFGFPASLIF